MPDETMECFLEIMIGCADGMAEAFRLLLHHYQLNIAEKKEFSRRELFGEEVE